MKSQKNIFIVLLAFLLFTGLTSCDNDETNDVPKNLEVQNFVWKGLNLYYLWQPEVTNLHDDRFATQAQLNAFIDDYENPAALFEDLLFERGSKKEAGVTDRFSWFIEDYIAQENSFQGINETTGLELGLVRIGTSSNIFGYVRYVIPGSDAADTNIKRGDIFTAVDGVTLTDTNFGSLLFGNNLDLTLNFADYNNGDPVLNGTSIALTKTLIGENPIHTKIVHEIGGKKIGYLMYNGFTSNYDSQLNDAFGEFKAAAIDELVLDLRYNGGGSVRTATYLASMITGQFTGELFAKEQWNTKWMDYFENNHPEYILNNFVDKMEDNTSINSLNLSSLYILTSSRSASASELIINGLLPYIDIKTIGETTYGKYVGSVTVYDAPNYGRDEANPNHKFAMQPIVLEMVNKLGENNKNGFDPTIPLSEQYGNLGTLGESSEPMLARAIQLITMGNKVASSKEIESLVIQKNISGSNEHTLLGMNMFIEKTLPQQ
ncbi:MAG: peptidase S41 [Flavobacteriaceae bacterium]|nr:MAG: peptidase S41 [Flavobacteriaceae bacterium]